jgi:type I restriction enzyme, S subunit
MTELRELPAGWRWATMGEVAKVVGGSTPKTGEPSYWGGDIPWITPDDLSGFNGKYIERGRRSITPGGYDSCSTQMVPAGTVLFTSRAPIGYVAIAANPVCTNQGFKSFVAKDEVDSEYLYWYLRGATELARSLASGTTFLELSGKAASRIPLPLPPLDEQREIVQSIERQRSALDEAAHGLASGARRLQRYRELILEVAIRGRLIGADVSDTGTGDQETELPSGWVISSLRDIAEFITDGDHNPPARVTAGVPHLTARNITRAGISPVRSTFISPADFDRIRKRYDPAPGDLLITSVGTIGRTAIVPVGLRFSADRNLAAVRLADSMDPRFFKAVLDAPSSQRVLKSLSGSTAQPHLYLNDLRRFHVPVPPPNEQEAIANEIERRMSIIDALAAAIDQAARRADVLWRVVLGAAFRGRPVHTSALA